LDTSVLGGYFDDEFKEATQELWRQMEQGRFRFLTSLVTVDELTEAPERVRELLTTAFAPGDIIEVTGEMEQLAAAYMSQATRSNGPKAKAEIEKTEM
jgi:predicted nucleic acid-binding protein